MLFHRTDAVPLVRVPVMQCHRAQIGICRGPAQTPSQIPEGLASTSAWRRPHGLDFDTDEPIPIDC
jgi:hypothetical protein